MENLDLDELSKVSRGRMMSNNAMKKFSVLALSGITAFTGVGFPSNIADATKIETERGWAYKRAEVTKDRAKGGLKIEIEKQMQEVSKYSIDTIKKELKGHNS